jgi:transposase-like protein/very-short-patch-repair endonuclease
MTDNEEIEYCIEEDELKTYSYINNGLCFEYFVGYEVASLIGYKNPKNVIKNVSKSNQLVFREYPGAKYPELDPRTILITRDGVIEILLKTRKRISPDVLHILKKFQIETTNKKCLTKEQQTLSAITNAFKTEKFEDQYKVDDYYLDLYFTEYKIIVECDENGHADRKPCDEEERMAYVNEKLGVNDEHWIRYNPDEYDFDISKVIGRIYRKMDDVKNRKFEEEKTHEKEDLIRKFEEERGLIKNVIPVEDDHVWKLEIEPTTGKFTAPPKEYLLKKLETQNISDIAKTYGISCTPIVKWLKQYDINIKDFTTIKVPEKEDIINQCKGRSQTEVAKYYKVSSHIIRKWMKQYDLDFKTLKSKDVVISKEELVKLSGDINDETKIAEKLGITVLNLQKLYKTHNIHKIPSKSELEIKLHCQSKDELAKFYKTTRTTLRKWIKTYGLEAIRCKVQTHKPIVVISSDNNETVYPSVKSLCKDLHISHVTVDRCLATGEKYNGFCLKIHSSDS